MKEEGASVAGYATRAPSPAIDGKHELSEFQRLFKNEIEILEKLKGESNVIQMSNHGNDLYYAKSNEVGNSREATYIVLEDGKGPDF